MNSQNFPKNLQRPGAHVNRRRFIQVAACAVLLPLPVFAKQLSPIPPRHKWVATVRCQQGQHGIEHDVKSCGFETPQMEEMTIVWVHFQGHEAVFGFQPIELKGVIPFHKIGRSGK